MGITVLDKSAPATQTRTEGRSRLLGIDVGYGYVKAVADTGVRACFPSVVAPAAADPLGGVLDDGVGHRVRVRALDGRAREVLVGEAALRSLHAQSFLGKDKPADLHDLFVLAAARLVNAGGSGPLPGQTALALGLPLSFYRSQKAALVRRIEALQAWVSVDGGPEVYLSFGPIAVFPQGAGAVLAHSDLLPGEDMVAVVDTGCYTVDYLLFEMRNGQPVPVPEACGSLEAGVHLVMKDLAAAFEAEAGAPLPARLHQRVLDAAREGKPTFHFGREIDLTAAFRESATRTARLIARQVASRWADWTGFIRATILCGGGALLLGDELAAGLPNAIVVPDPVFANAEGFLKMLTGILPA